MLFAAYPTLSLGSDMSVALENEHMKENIAEELVQLVDFEEEG
jgi:hypothetical protein